MIKSLHNEFYHYDDDFQKIIKSHPLCIDKNVQITPSSHGKSSFVFFVKNNTQEYIFKFPRTTFSVETIEKERNITNILKNQIKYHIPNIHIEKHADRLFSVYKMIKGENMSDIKLGEVEKISLAQELAKFIFTFHSIPVESIPYAIGSKLDSLELFCKDFCYTPIFDSISELFNERTLIHGDFHRSNIIIEKKRLNGVLDFATISIGSKYFDIGHMMFSMDDKFNDHFIREYEKASNSRLDYNMIEKVIKFLDDMINKNYLQFIKKNQYV